MTRPTINDQKFFNLWAKDLGDVAKANGVTKAEIITALKLLLYPHPDEPLTKMLDWTFCDDYLQIYEELQND